MSLTSAVLFSALSAWPASLPTLPSTPGATEGCALQSVLSLPSYQAMQTAQGELNLEVRCPDSQASYRLNWPQATALPGGLLVSLPSGLQLKVQDVRGQLSGQTVQTGSQRLKFAVRAEAGQWGVPRGQASLRGPLLSPVAGSAW